MQTTTAEPPAYLQQLPSSLSSSSHVRQTVLITGTPFGTASGYAIQASALARMIFKTYTSKDGIPPRIIFWLCGANATQDDGRMTLSTRRWYTPMSVDEYLRAGVCSSMRRDDVDPTQSGEYRERARAISGGLLCSTETSAGNRNFMRQNIEIMLTPPERPREGKIPVSDVNDVVERLGVTLFIYYREVQLFYPTAYNDQLQMLSGNHFPPGSLPRLVVNSTSTPPKPSTNSGGSGGGGGMGTGTGQAPRCATLYIYPNHTMAHEDGAHLRHILSLFDAVAFPTKKGLEMFRNSLLLCAADITVNHVKGAEAHAQQHPGEAFRPFQHTDTSKVVETLITYANTRLFYLPHVVQFNTADVFVHQNNAHRDKGAAKRADKTLSASAIATSSTLSTKSNTVQADHAFRSMLRNRTGPFVREAMRRAILPDSEITKVVPGAKSNATVENMVWVFENQGNYEQTNRKGFDSLAVATFILFDIWSRILQLDDEFPMYFLYRSTSDKTQDALDGGATLSVRAVDWQLILRQLLPRCSEVFAQSEEIVHELMDGQSALNRESTSQLRHFPNGEERGVGVDSTSRNSNNNIRSMLRHLVKVKKINEDVFRLESRSSPSVANLLNELSDSRGRAVDAPKDYKSMLVNLNRVQKSMQVCATRVVDMPNQTVSTDFIRNAVLSSDVYWQTSRMEGFGIPVAEAQICACPAVIPYGYNEDLVMGDGKEGCGLGTVCGSQAEQNLMYNKGMREMWTYPAIDKIVCGALYWCLVSVCKGTMPRDSNRPLMRASAVQRVHFAEETVRNDCLAPLLKFLSDM